MRTKLLHNITLTNVIIGSLLTHLESHLCKFSHSGAYVIYYLSCQKHPLHPGLAVAKIVYRKVMLEH